MIFVDLLNNFLIYLAVEKGLSKNTTESYSLDLRKFQKFLSSRDKGFASFAKVDIIDFMPAPHPEGGQGSARMAVARGSSPAGRATCSGSSNA